MILKYLNPKNDFVFKKIFGQDKNRDLLISMLNLVLGKKFHKKIKDVRFLPTILPPDVNDNKYGIVDVLCEDEDGCKYIVEMQVAKQDDFTMRAQHYATKVFANQLPSGGQYKNLKEVIFLAFCDFEIFEGDEHYKSNFVNYDPDKCRTLKGLSYTFIDLPKFEKQRSRDPQALSLEEKFYYFLHHAEEMRMVEIWALANKDPFLTKTAEQAYSANFTAEEIEGYNKAVRQESTAKSILIAAKEEGIKEGIKEGEKKGEKRGERKGIEKTIKLLVKKGIISEEEGQKQLKALEK